MGKWVIFIGEADVLPKSIRAMSFSGQTGVKDWGVKQLDVSFPEGRVSFQFDYDGSIRRDYGPAVWKALPYQNPECVLLRYTTPEVLLRIVNASDFPENVLIDADGAEDCLSVIIGRHRLLLS